MASDPTPGITRGSDHGVDTDRGRELLDAGAAFVDVRTPAEWAGGSIPGAVFIELTDHALIDRVHELHAQSNLPVVVFCHSGSRSELVVRAAEAAVPGSAVNLTEGLIGWAGAAMPLEGALTSDQLDRYSRHIVLPEVGATGQARLLSSRVLIIGAGGLGNPASLYLAAAGVGVIGIADGDAVSRSNLQRQILYRDADVGASKAHRTAAEITDLNPDVQVELIASMLTTDNVETVLHADGAGWDVIVDATDDIGARYLVGAAAAKSGIPVVHGSLDGFEGRVTVFAPPHGPCYECWFPQPPVPGVARSCAERGVLGAVPGVIGAMQAAETLKLLLGVGRTLVGRLVIVDMLAGTTAEFRLGRRPECPACSDNSA